MTRRYEANKPDARTALRETLEVRATIDTHASTVTSLARSYGMRETDVHRMLVDEQCRRAGQ